MIRAHKQQRLYQNIKTDTRRVARPDGYIRFLKLAEVYKMIEMRKILHRRQKKIK